MLTALGVPEFYRPLVRLLIFILYFCWAAEVRRIPGTTRVTMHNPIAAIITLVVWIIAEALSNIF